jgi:hypothetical protein
MFSPMSFVETVMRSHFDIEIEDAIRKEPKYTNAVSIELTHNEAMILIVESLTKKTSTLPQCKNATAQFYDGELLAMVYEMLDQISIANI